jgi:hypothetical protein
VTLLESAIFGITFYLVYRNTISENDSLENVNEKKMPISSSESTEAPDSGITLAMVGIGEETTV